MRRVDDFPGDLRGGTIVRDPSRREFSLQFFAAEDEGRTEDPTERKKEEAREEGNIASTTELASALVMAAGFSVLWFFGTWMVWEIEAFSHKILSLQYMDGVRPDNVGVLFGNMAWVLVKVVGPVAAAAYVAAIFSFMIQTGPTFTLEPLQFDLSAIQPSFQKLLDEMIFSKQVLWDFIKSLMKVATVIGVAVEVIYSNFDSLLVLIEMSLFGALGVVMSMAFEIILKAILLLLFIMSPLDYAFEYYEWYQDLKMTKQEVEDEQKQQEGDPEMQERQQERMQEMSEKRMMEEVPEADVVITNPTHYAVALQYDEAMMEAPTVVARGEGMRAKRIRNLAREHDIPIYEVPLLARTLFDLDVGAEIPQNLYESVATVLKWVHEQKNEAPDQERVHIEQDLKELDLAAAG
jgi:flagellar biosynthetic protein FlhB